jgi:hypothetical protein
MSNDDARLVHSADQAHAFMRDRLPEIKAVATKMEFGLRLTDDECELIRRVVWLAIGDAITRQLEETT